MGPPLRERAALLRPHCPPPSLGAPSSPSSCVDRRSESQGASAGEERRARSPERPRALPPGAPWASPWPRRAARCVSAIHWAHRCRRRCSSSPTAAACAARGSARWAARLPCLLPRASRHSPIHAHPFSPNHSCCSPTYPPQHHDHRQHHLRRRRGGGGGLLQLRRYRHHRLVAPGLAPARRHLPCQPVQPLRPALDQGGAPRLAG